MSYSIGFMINGDQEIGEKMFQYLLYLLDTSTTYDTHEIVAHSRLYLRYVYVSGYPETTYNLTIKVDPDIFKKYQGGFRQQKDAIAHKIREVIPTMIIREITVIPDLDKFQILQNRIVPVNTPWGEINSLQDSLLEQLRSAEQTIDFQNIGNTSRAILQKLSDIVFNPSIHVEPSVDLSPGKYKNRLHTYIKTELPGQPNDELRSYADSVIDTANKGADLANKLTHDTKAESWVAESCVISVITVVSIIKLIENRSKK